MRSTGCAVQLLLNSCFAKLIYHYLQFSLNNFERSSLCLNATITFIIITEFMPKIFAFIFYVRRRAHIKMELFINGLYKERSVTVLFWNALINMPLFLNQFVLHFYETVIIVSISVSLHDSGKLVNGTN